MTKKNIEETLIILNMEKEIAKDKAAEYSWDYPTAQYWAGKTIAYEDCIKLVKKLSNKLHKE